MKKELLKSIFIFGAVVPMFTGITGCGFRVVDSGERGVKTTFGKADEKPLTPGLSFKWPIIQGITLYDVRVQKKQEQTKLFSSDVQETTVDYALNYSLDPSRVTEIYQR